MKTQTQDETASGKPDCPKCGEHFSTCICEETNAPEAPYKPYYDRHNDGLPAPQAKHGLQPQAQHSPLPWREGMSRPSLITRIENLEGYSDKLKASADKLAEALRDMVASQERRGGSPSIGASLTSARAALAAWESEGQKTTEVRKWN